jgi:hypothetical protein
MRWDASSKESQRERAHYKDPLRTAEGKKRERIPFLMETDWLNTFFVLKNRLIVVAYHDLFRHIAFLRLLLYLGSIKFASFSFPSLGEVFFSSATA